MSFTSRYCCVIMHSVSCSDNGVRRNKLKMLLFQSTSKYSILTKKHFLFICTLLLYITIVLLKCPHLKNERLHWRPWPELFRYIASIITCITPTGSTPAQMTVLTSAYPLLYRVISAVSSRCIIAHAWFATTTASISTTAIKGIVATALRAATKLHAARFVPISPARQRIRTTVLMPTASR